MKLKGKTAIVTGSSSGIGKAIAEEFLRQGAFVVFSDINEAHVPDEERAIFFKCDVSKKEEVENLIKQAVDKFNGLDIMINNAGIGTTGDIVSLDDKTWDKTIAVNLSGVFYGLRAAAKYMKENNIKGSIINMTSILGTVGFKDSISYSASKGGVNQLTRAGALDLASFGIRVNAIAPGFIKTQMTKAVTDDPKFKAQIEQATPLGRMGEPEDIAKAALYLASDDSKFVTGSVLFVDGGWTAQ
ncbi:MAG: SDR family NAD(P)-dependent oxidoreductase [Candidatus Paceibacterota bacterium]|jgi:NAD(P)-dependent dehydrogenase (short-subunit alcohol dehydrogenase family)